MSVELANNAWPAGAVEPADAGMARRVARLSFEYALRAFQLIVEAVGDFRSALLVQAINTANTAHLNAHAEWGRQAAASRATFPDEARRPISISRLADSLGAPFETTRRIVQRLVDEGTCARVEGGIIVPRISMERPEIVRNVIANIGYLRRLVRDLQATGLVAPEILAWAQGAEPAGQDSFVARTAARLSAEYVLRALELLVDTYGDVRDGVIAHAIVHANTAHLDTRTGEGWRYAGVGETPPDTVRKPTSVAGVAESLGLPFETARRHVQRLVYTGICIRIEGGLIVPQAVLARPVVGRAALANVVYVRKFMRDLAAAGVAEIGHPSSAGAQLAARLEDQESANR